MNGSYLPINTWKALLTRQRKPIDPYFVWLDLTGFRGLMNKGEQPKIFTFVAEGDCSAFREAVDGIDDLKNLLTIPEAFFSPLANGKPSKFFTFSVDIGSLDIKLIPGFFQRLQSSNHVTRMQAGYARAPATSNVAHAKSDDTAVTSAGAATAPDDKDYDEPNSYQSCTLKTATGVVIGVIDDGCAFAHARLLTPRNSTRIAAYWNQSSLSDRFRNATLRWTTNPSHYGFHYGAVASNGSLNELITQNTRHCEVDERSCYQSVFGGGVRNRGMYGRDSHGAAVTMLAAGRLHKQAATDVAGDAPVIFVDLPLEQVAISSGRWLPINALDAMRFIIKEAREKFSAGEHGDVPVVINLSSGSSAGAHDGNSMLECAMEELLTADDRLAIVVAAGNGRLSETHITHELAQSAAWTFGIHIPHDKKFETHTELWFEKGANVSALSIQITSPLGGKLAVNSRKPIAVLKAPDGKTYAGIVFCENPSQSPGRLMVLISIIGTNPHPYLNRAPGGNWEVTIENESNTSIRVNGWIERDEVVFGRRRPQLARFYDDTHEEAPLNDWEETKSGQLVTRIGTTSNIANSRNVVVAAAGMGTKSDGYPSPYSGAPMGSGGVSAIARADRNAAVPGALVSGNYRSAIRHMNGSSVAAPLVTRFLAGELATKRSRASVFKSWPKKITRKHPRTGKVAPNDGILNLCEAPAQIGSFETP